MKMKVYVIKIMIYKGILKNKQIRSLVQRKRIRKLKSRNRNEKSYE